MTEQIMVAARVSRTITAYIEIATVEATIGDVDVRVRAGFRPTDGAISALNIRARRGRRDRSRARLRGNPPRLHLRGPLLAADTKNRVLLHGRPLLADLAPILTAGRGGDADPVLAAAGMLAGPYAVREAVEEYERTGTFTRTASWTLDGRESIEEGQTP